VLLGERFRRIVVGLGNLPGAQIRLDQLGIVTGPLVVISVGTADVTPDLRCYRVFPCNNVSVRNFRTATT